LGSSVCAFVWDVLQNNGNTLLCPLFEKKKI